MTATVPAPVDDGIKVVDRATARRFVDRHIKPHANEFESASAIPEETLKMISEAGLWAPFLPSSSGGSAADLVSLGHIHEEVGRGCSSVRSLLTVHTMVAGTVHRWGTAAQRRRWLPSLAAGDLLGAFCLTEPDVGSDATQIATRATSTRDGWVLDGVKKWITGGQRADVFLVFARTDNGIGAFLVPSDATGVVARPISYVLGTRASMLADVTFDNVVLDGDALLGPDGFAAGMVMSAALDLGRYSVAAGSVGIVQACLDASAAYAARRMVRSAPLRDYQLIQAKLSNMVTDVHAGRLLYERAGRLKDEGDSATIMATWVAKYFASTAAARHASEAVQIHGANGCGTDFPVERFYRDAKVMEIIEGSTEIQQTTIAAHAYREGMTG
jgi:alkylation response protein AidB-like acyl-CoA dehydrogenase